MYIPVHFLASSFSDEKLDTVWNHWLPVSTVMFLIDPPAVHGGIEPKLAFNAPKDGRGIGQKQDDMFLITGRCGTLIWRDKGAGSRLTQNARKSWIKKNLVNEINLNLLP